MSGDGVDPTGDEPWWPTAARALHLAVDGDLDAAVELVDGLAGYGMEAVALSMCAWADYCIAHQPAQRTGPGPVELVTLDPVDGRVVDAQAVPPRSRWAAQMLAARAAGDGQLWRDLMLSTGTDHVEWRARVITVLLTCALNVRDAKRAGARPVYVWPIAETGG